MIKMVVTAFTIILILFAAFVSWVWFSTFQPDQTQPAKVDNINNNGVAPPLPNGGEFKLLSWNVQFMAGKGYQFYYGGGPDRRPSPEDITETTKEVARIIKAEDPDLVLLQEVDDGAKRTDHENQLENLLDLLPDEYGSFSSAFYWKSAFSPHPKIMGSTGTKLSVISKYEIEKATRHQLPLKPDNWLVKQFDLKRAVLEVELSRKGGKNLLVFNTHLTAFAHGSDVRKRQIDEISSLLTERENEDFPWVLGGDFNLRPPGSENGRGEVIKPLFENYQAVPGYEEVNGPNPEDWYTHFPNDPEIKEPNKTIDYFFISEELGLGEHYVRRKDTLDISDHLPLVIKVNISEN